MRRGFGLSAAFATLVVGLLGGRRAFARSRRPAERQRYFENWLLRGLYVSEQWLSERKRVRDDA